MIINKLYKTKITSSSYNVDLNATPTITVTVLDFNNAAITGESMTLTCSQGSFSNNSATYTATTNSSGQINVTYTANTAGLVTFTCDNQTLQISVASNPYPVGSIYVSINSTSPANLFGGSWTQLTNTFLYASTTADTNATTAPSGQGEATHTLTQAELPKHTHRIHDWTIIVSAGGNSGQYTPNYSGNNWCIARDDRDWSARQTWDNDGSNNLNNQAHNNMPPYMKVYMWKRTA